MRVVVPENSAVRQPGWRDVLALSGLVLFGAFPLAVGYALHGMACIVLVTAGLLPAEAHRRRSAIACVLIGALNGYWGLSGRYFIWPLQLLVPVVLTFAAWRVIRGDAKGVLRPGRITSITMLWIAAIGIGSAIALIAWNTIAQPDLSALRSLLPAWPAALLIGSAALFSLANAILEELIWRGWIQNWLAVALGIRPAIVLQAASFGLAHWAGLPSGWTGVMLASAYGLLLGALANKTKGLLAPFLAHVATDAAVFGILASVL